MRFRSKQTKIISPTRSVVPGILNGIDYGSLISIQADNSVINEVNNNQSIPKNNSGMRRILRRGNNKK